MKFAVISDVHGNLPALNAVIEDAEKENIDNFIFVGDYCLSNPYPDECITRIKSLAKKYVIRGNEETYIENLVGKDPSTWVDGQMQISYWCYQSLSRENRDYLLSLPTHMNLRFRDVSLHISHSSTEFIADSEYKEWSAPKTAERYRDEFISQSALREDIHGSLKSDRQFNAVFGALSDGIYIFGHSHIQWSYRSDDGKKILLNPGSCGLPLDCVENGVPYTVIDISDSKNIIVEERRVPFNEDEYIAAFVQSGQFVKANVWSNVILKEIKTNRECLTFFLRHVEDYAAKIQDSRRPFSVSTWEQAYELWRIDNE